VWNWGKDWETFFDISDIATGKIKPVSTIEKGLSVLSSIPHDNNRTSLQNAIDIVSLGLVPSSIILRGCHRVRPQTTLLGGSVGLGSLCCCWLWSLFRGKIKPVSTIEKGLSVLSSIPHDNNRTSLQNAIDMGYYVDGVLKACSVVVVWNWGKDWETFFDGWNWLGPGIFNKLFNTSTSRAPFSTDIYQELSQLQAKILDYQAILIRRKQTGALCDSALWFLALILGLTIHPWGMYPVKPHGWIVSPNIRAKNHNALSQSAPVCFLRVC
jgi:hypothetical protein